MHLVSKRLVYNDERQLRAMLTFETGAFPFSGYFVNNDGDYAIDSTFIRVFNSFIRVMSCTQFVYPRNELYSIRLSA